MNQFRHKGKFVKKNQVEHREKRMEAMRKCRAKRLEQVQEPHHEQEEAPSVSIPEPTSPVKPECIIEGLRIIDIAYVTEQMSCDSCSTLLCFSSIEGETKIGLASIFKIRCANCLDVKSVYTSRKIPSENKRSSYNINCRAATCSIDAGINHKQLMKFLAAINIPFPNEATLRLAEKRRREENAPVAEESSTKVIKEAEEPTPAASSADE